MSEMQVVVFDLGPERYGLDIASVYEIIRHQSIAAVPRSPSFVRGVINLRGRIVPVVDVHARFDVAAPAVTGASRIIVVEAAGTRVGLEVDGVSEVLMIPADAVEPTPAVATGSDATYLRGIAKLGEQLIILLDLDLLFGTEDAARVRATVTRAAPQEAAAAQAA
jgi:purine-binding chemotaxis protein CheW